MLVVQKFGGTSVADLDRMRAVAKRVLETQRAGNHVVVICSAMAGETNRLLAMAREISPDPEERECDVIAATGEQVSVGLLALAIQARGGKAQSFLGHQVRVLTDSAFARARIRGIDKEKIDEALGEGNIAVVAGYQGIDDEGNITTLGRGGSDTSAVAMAVALGADVCEIYTDVDGVYTTDPSLCPDARKIDRISFEEMLELASVGAKVLQTRSVELAMKHAMPIHVRSSFNRNPGTWVVPEEDEMEEVLVAGVTVARDDAKVTVADLPDVPGIVAQVFRPIADVGVVVDMIVQNVSAEGRTDMTFTVPRGDVKRAVTTLKERVPELTEGGILTDDDIVKVSVVGVGMRSHAGVAARMFELFAREGINIEMISTSEIKISCIIRAKYAELAVRVLHDGFQLGKPPKPPRRPSGSRGRRSPRRS